MNWSAAHRHGQQTVAGYLHEGKSLEQPEPEDDEAAREDDREEDEKAEFGKEHDAAYKEDEAGLREMMRLPTPERNSLRTGMRMKKQDPRTQNY